MSLQTVMSCPNNTYRSNYHLVNYHSKEQNGKKICGNNNKVISNRISNKNNNNGGKPKEGNLRMNLIMNANASVKMFNLYIFYKMQHHL